jgi:acyl carrier protein
MLTQKPTPGDIEHAVHRAITDILERHGKQVEPFDNAADLVATGLTSLDLAALVAVLERQWKVDPFLESASITDIRTVGDLCRAYQNVLHGEPLASQSDAALRQAYVRASGRRK